LGWKVMKEDRTVRVEPVKVVEEVVLEVKGYIDELNTRVEEVLF